MSVKGLVEQLSGSLSANAILVAANNFPATYPITYTNLTEQPLYTASGSNVSATSIHKAGHSELITPTETIVEASGAAFAGFLTAALPVRIRAGGNVNDTAVGTGARTVSITGLDASCNVISETVTTAGASASAATAQSFFRVSLARVVTSGTYTNGVNDANIGAIVIETTSGASMTTILAGVGQNQAAIYTVPAGKTAYLTRLYCSARTPCSFRVAIRPNADVVVAPFSAKRLTDEVSNITGGFLYDFRVPLRLEAKTDVWITCFKETGGTTQVSAAFDLVIVN